LGDQIEKNIWTGHVERKGKEKEIIQGVGENTCGKDTTWKTQA
jgi:hypothetical protein